MTKEKTTLVKYSMSYHTPEIDEKRAQTLLAWLLQSVARDLASGKFESLTEYSEITISLLKRGSKEQFVFELKAMEEDEWLQ